MSSIPADSIANLATAPLAVVGDRLLTLLATAAYREGDFVLSSGQPSPYYLNCKPVTLAAEGALATGRLVAARLPAETVAVGGLTLGADPIVSAVSVMSALAGRPVAGLIVRKAAKGHGTMDYIEGPPLPAGSSVVVLEDVVTTGNSALVAVERLRAVGYRVDRLVALVDRQQGGADLYAGQGLEFEALWTIAEVQQRWRELGGA